MRRSLCLLALALGFVWACPFDQSLREYLGLRFWYPFAAYPERFARPNPKPVSVPFAGLILSESDSPLARLRGAYSQARTGIPAPGLAPVLAAARAQPALTPIEQDEVELLEAKIILRSLTASDTQPADPQSLVSVKQKLIAFIRQARTPHYLSEARGWLARTHYLLGEQSAAGKIYLDELHRDGSNLSQQTLTNSLRMTYGYDGGPKLRQQLADYFDTPAHAAFAIHLVTNPRDDHRSRFYDPEDPKFSDRTPPPYTQIKALLDRHANLLRSESGTQSLALLAMRTALRAADPPAALRLAAQVPANSPLRASPDFLWMLASAHYLSRGYTHAEAPLLRLQSSPRASELQKAAAAYELCGVYRKTGNEVEQLRWALWLFSDVQRVNPSIDFGSAANQSVYWAASGFDLGLLLDVEVSIDGLRGFLDRYPQVPDLRLVSYALAVRLTRENQYEEAAQIYQSLRAIPTAPIRAARAKELAKLYSAIHTPEGKYRFAEFLSGRPDGIYFNDTLWYRFQTYALRANTDSRFTRPERERQIAAERKLKDEQEELWRAQLLLREVIRDVGPTELGRKAARLAIDCIRRISERFDRAAALRDADIQLSTWLATTRRSPTAEPY